MTAMTTHGPPTSAPAAPCRPSTAGRRIADAVGRLSTLVRRVRTRAMRNRAYRDLLALDDHLLDDLGLTYAQVAEGRAEGLDPDGLLRLDPLNPGRGP